MSKEKVERNMTIYNMKIGRGYERKYTYRELAARYHLSKEAIQVIVKRCYLREMEENV